MICNFAAVQCESLTLGSSHAGVISLAKEASEKIAFADNFEGMFILRLSSPWRFLETRGAASSEEYPPSPTQAFYL